MDHALPCGHRRLLQCTRAASSLIHLQNPSYCLGFGGKGHGVRRSSLGGEAAGEHLKGGGCARQVGCPAEPQTARAEGAGGQEACTGAAFWGRVRKVG